MSVSVMNMARLSRPHSQKDLKRHWIVAVSEIEYSRFGVDRYIRSQPQLPSAILDLTASAAKNICPDPAGRMHPGLRKKAIKRDHPDMRFKSR